MTFVWWYPSISDGKFIHLGLFSIREVLKRETYKVEILSPFTVLTNYFIHIYQIVRL